MKYYAIGELARMAGVSVRTLHHYNQAGLLKPAFRTGAGYRMYGKEELLRLQQILLYKELDFGLDAIRRILDDPGFDLQCALEGHREQLLARRSRIDTLIETLDKTMLHVQNRKQMNYEELYKGLPREEAAAWRREAQERWPGQVEHAEAELLKMSREEFTQLQEGFKNTTENLAALSGSDPRSEEVQELIDAHYRYILRFWGKTGNLAEAYKGLGSLYATDPRYTEVAGAPNPAFGIFLKEAMTWYAHQRLTSQ